MVFVNTTSKYYLVDNFEHKHKIHLHFEISE